MLSRRRLGGQEQNSYTSTTPEGLRITSTLEKETDSKEFIEHLYLNVSIFNDTNTLLNASNITQTRDQPYLTSPGDYNVTISRFAIASSGTPLLVQKLINLGAQPGINDKLWVGFKYNNIPYSFIVVLPGTLLSQYSAVFNINEFLYYINIAFETALGSLNAANPGIAPRGCVIMTYDSSTGLYKINVPEYFITSGIRVGMSYDLYTKFFGFDASIGLTYTTVAPNERLGVDILVYNTGNNTLQNTAITPLSVPPLNPGENWFQMSQDKAWPSSICDATSIQISTSQIPIQSEYVLTGSQQNQGFGNGQSSILTDFLIGRNVEYISGNEPFVYVPNLYRLVCMHGSKSQNLYTYDIKVQIKSFDGRLEPLYLLPQTSASFKILFVKKGLSN